MDLLLWRHAQAEDGSLGGDDLARALTRRGEKQASRVGAWLQERLPEDTRVLCSPARRCQQTAAALGRAFETAAPLAPGADAQQVLRTAGWPDAQHPVLIVGHQPTLGETVARLLGLPTGQCDVRKASVWWLRTRLIGEQPHTSVVAVQSPDTV